MIISVTERGTFKRCHKQWDYASRNRQAITPIIPPTAFSLGTLIHKAMQLWIENPTGSASDYFGKAAVLEIEAIKLRYRKFVGADISEPEIERLEDMFGLGHEMMMNYQEHWDSPLEDGFELVKAEQTIVVPIPNSEHVCETCGGVGFFFHEVDNKTGTEDCRQCMGSGYDFHYLEGTLDAIIRDTRSGLLFVKENKTYGTRPKVEHLESNDQFTAYCWILSQLDMGDVGGVAYDGLWKRPIHTERGPDRQLKDLFLRTLLTRSKAELKTFERELLLEVQEMANPNIYRNLKWDGCWDCQYKQLCLAEYRDEDADWIRKEYFMARQTDIPWPEAEEVDV